MLATPMYSLNPGDPSNGTGTFLLDNIPYALYNRNSASPQERRNICAAAKITPVKRNHHNWLTESSALL